MDILTLFFSGFALRQTRITYSNVGLLEAVTKPHILSPKRYDKYPWDSLIMQAGGHIKQKK